MEIGWREEYSVGVEEIDRQHQDFIKLIRRLKILQQKGNPKHLVIRILRELGAYAAYHFVSEENFMFLTRYPDLKIQEIEHARLQTTLIEKVAQYESNRFPLEKLVIFLEDWFIKHTSEEDKKIGIHINALGNKTAD
jgi:hemerythrin